MTTPDDCCGCGKPLDASGSCESCIAESTGYWSMTDSLRHDDLRYSRTRQILAKHPTARQDAIVRFILSTMTLAKDLYDIRRMQDTRKYCNLKQSGAGVSDYIMSKIEQEFLEIFGTPLIQVDEPQKTSNINEI